MIIMKSIFSRLVVSIVAFCLPTIGAWAPTKTGSTSTRSSWTSLTSSPRRVTNARVFNCHQTKRDDDNDSLQQTEGTLNRRQVLDHIKVTTVVGLVTVLSPSRAHATEDDDGEDDQSPPRQPDPLDRLGQTLFQPQSTDRPRWPDSSVSPLLPPTEQYSSTTPPTGSDLSKALEGIQKKRQIDPRTHG